MYIFPSLAPLEPDSLSSLSHYPSIPYCRSISPLLVLHLNLLRRERAELVLDRHNFVRALLARLDDLAVLVRDVMSGLKDNALLSLLRVGAASVGELERRGSPELEQ